MNGDRFSAEEPGVLERIGGHQCDLLLRDHFQNRPRDRNVAPLGAFDELCQLRNRVAFRIKQENEPALDRQVLEDHLHHSVEQRVEVIALEQRLRHLHENLKDFFARDLDRFEAGLRRNPRHGFLSLGEVEPEFGIEIGNATDDRARRIIEHRLVAEIHGWLRLQLELY